MTTTRFAPNIVLDDRLKLPRKASQVINEARHSGLSLDRYHTIIQQQVDHDEGKGRRAHPKSVLKARVASRLAGIEDTYGKNFEYDRETDRIKLI